GLRAGEVDGRGKEDEFLTERGEGGEKEEGEGNSHVNSSLIGSTPRSTSGIGRPCAPGNSTPRSMPRPRYTVAAIMAGETGRSFGAAPMSSVDPTTVPPFSGPPPISIVQACGQ